MNAAVINLDDRRLLEQPLEKGQTRQLDLTLSTANNWALALAQRERFDLMCEDILWPGEDQLRFGEMLRGIVIGMKPENRMHLEVLRNVASCQWKLYRNSRLQKNLVLSQTESGKFNLPIGTTRAMEVDAESSRLTADLSRTISIYWSVRRD